MTDAETVTPVDTLQDVDVGSPNGTATTNFDGIHYVDPDDLADAVERAAHPRNDDADDVPVAEWKRSTLPRDDLSGFGEPLDDCGQQIPASQHFCTDCLAVHDMPRNCLRYDCPQHWAHAIRRRAAGCKHAAGLAPQMGALYGYLQHWRDDQQFYHHLVIDVFGAGDGDYLLESNQPRQRSFELVRELMDTLGIQGTVIYHPWKGDTEDGEDDRGKWKTRLSEHREWEDDVRDELRYDPHFHIVGVGPKLDLEDIGRFHSRTGWIINRIADDNNVSLFDDDAMVDALLYSMSHAGVYETDGGQRRLAARMKGPDVNRVVPDRQTQHRYKRIVNDAAEQVLGIPAPDMTCHEELDEEYDLGGHDDGLPDVERSGSPLADAWQPDEIATASTIGRGAPGGASGDTGQSTGFDSVGGQKSRETDLPGTASDLPSTPSTTYGGGDAVATDDDQEQETTYCGGYLKHISQAGAALLDQERREKAPHADELDDAYREYVAWMRERNLDPQHGQREVAEFQDSTSALDDDLPGYSEHNSTVLKRLADQEEDPPD